MASVAAAKATAATEAARRAAAVTEA